MEERENRSKQQKSVREIPAWGLKVVRFINHVQHSRNPFLRILVSDDLDTFFFDSFISEIKE